MEIPFSGQYEQRDFVRAFNAHRMSSWFSRIVYIGTWAMIAYAVITIGSVVAQGRYQKDNMLGYLPSVLLFVAIVAYLIYQPNFATRRVMKSPEMQAPVSGTFGDEGFHIQTALGAAGLNWNVYTKLLDKGDYVILYQKSNNFNIFPRRFFQSDEDWQAFKRLVKEKIK